MNNNKNTRRCAPPCGAASRAASAGRAEEAPLRRCDPDAVLPVMAYVPAQEFGEVFSECQAFHSGTLFPALYKPFCGKGCR